MRLISRPTHLMNRYLLPLLLAQLFATGCGPSGPVTYPVRGTVTFDGEPVKEGDILFIPDDAALAPEGGKIADGTFQMVSKPGTCQVKITALDINEDTEWISGSPIASNFIPAWYNDETTLSVEVEPNSRNDFQFQLTSQPQP